MLLPVDGLLITCKELCFNLQARRQSLSISGKVLLRSEENGSSCPKSSVEGIWKRTTPGAAMEQTGDEELLRERSAGRLPGDIQGMISGIQAEDKVESWGYGKQY